MAKKKQHKKSTQVPHKEKDQKQVSGSAISLVVPVNNDTASLEHFLSGFANSATGADSLIFSTYDQADKCLKILKSNEKVQGLISDSKCFIVENAKSESEAVYNALLNVTQDYVAVIDIKNLKSPFNLDDIMAIKKNQVSKNKILTCHYREEANHAFRNSHAFVLHADLGRYIFKDLINSLKDYKQAILYRLNQLGISNESLVFGSNNPYSSNGHRKSNPFTYCISRLISCTDWFFIVPVKELKTSPQNTHYFLKQSSVFRLLFAAMAVILFFLLPFLSFDAGISGDEYTIYKQAEKVYRFYESGGDDTAATFSNTIDPMHLYGISFDVVVLAIEKLFNVEAEYTLRHVFNSLTGWVAILFTGLFVAMITGWRGGFIAMLLLVVSPRFLGHVFNNPKDIPFAMGYIFTMFFMLKLLKQFPKPKLATAFWTAAGIAITISLRIGGLMLIPYLVMFAGLWWLFHAPNNGFLGKQHIAYFKRIATYVIGISLAGYFLGLILWPYGLLNPLKNPIDALNVMTDFSITLRQLFEGSIIWSDQIPWYYVIKYMFISIPVIIMLGFLAFVFFLRQLGKKYNGLWMFIILFAFIFPIFWVIYKQSNLHGGWRHFAFAYVFMISGAALGLDYIIDRIKSKRLKWIPFAVMLILAIHPIRHIIVNHPYQYIYYNEIKGGVKGAYGEFELDYYFHSVKEASEYLLDEIDYEQYTPENPVIVATNYGKSEKYYFRHHMEQTKIHYLRYYERGNFDWDYAIVVNTYIEPYQMLNGYFPPSNTIYNVEVDGKPICAVLERKDKKDLEGFKAVKNKELDKAISLYEQHLDVVPDNEVARLNLVEALINTKNFEQALNQVNKLLEINPNYEHALYYQGMIYLNIKQFNNALQAFKHIIDVNFKYAYGYFGAANAYVQLNNIYAAEQALKQGLQVNQRFKPFYLMLANIYKAQGKTDLANQYLQVAKQLQ